MSPALVLVMFFVQAEPAPPPAVTPPPPAPPPVIAPEETPEPPVWALGLTIGGGYRVGKAAKDVPPALGLAFSTFAGRRYAALGRIELGVSASFYYQRYARIVTFKKMVSPGMEVDAQGDRLLSTGEFAASQTLTVVLGRYRPWLAVGGGVSIDHFTSPETRYRPGESRRTLPLVLGAAGFHLEVAPQTDAGLQLDYAHLFEPTFTTEGGERLHLFGDRLAARLEMQYRF
ncbi:MAG TPA: hypothetical protein VN914_00180 [Polyangia bacterium]|nr:hypothetical protein [Polyangia bacterium]